MTDVRMSARTRVGATSAYLSGSDVGLVREVRQHTGRVTVSGRTGLSVLRRLAADDDLDGIDYDPADYLRLQRAGTPTQLELFPADLVAPQRDCGLATIRSAGRYVARDDVDALRDAMTEPLPHDVVRVVSLHSGWLGAKHSRTLLGWAGAADNPLALVFADTMDPLSGPAAVDILLALAEMAGSTGRRVELLRSDTSAIGFAANGGSLGAIGLTPSGRHHGLPMSRRRQNETQQRNRSPYVLVPELLSWQRGSILGALSEFDSLAHLTGCTCEPCAGRTLQRFDHIWPDQVPREVTADATRHDVAVWSTLAHRILSADDPSGRWARACHDADQEATRIAGVQKIAVRLPPALRRWARCR